MGERTVHERRTAVIRAAVDRAVTTRTARILAGEATR